MNDDVRCVLPWDSDFHRMYEMHGVKIEYKDWEFEKPNTPVQWAHSDTLQPDVGTEGGGE